MSEFVSKKVHKPRLNHGSDHSYSCYDGDNHGTKNYRSNLVTLVTTILPSMRQKLSASFRDSTLALRQPCGRTADGKRPGLQRRHILRQFCIMYGHVLPATGCRQAGLAMKRARTQGPVSQELMLLLQSTEHRAFPSSRHGFHNSTLSRPDRFNPLFVAVLSRSDEPGRQLTTDSGQRHRKNKANTSDKILRDPALTSKSKCGEV